MCVCVCVCVCVCCTITPVLQYNSQTFTKQHPFTVQFSGIPSIKRFAVYTTLSCPTLTHARTHERRWTLLTWIKRFSSNLSVWSRKTTLTGRSAAVETLLNSFHWGFGHYKTHDETLHFQTRAVSSPFWVGLLQRGSLFFVLCSWPGHPLQATPL